MNLFFIAAAAIAFLTIGAKATQSDLHHGRSPGCNCSNKTHSASQLISQALNALGGESAITQLTGVIYDSGEYVLDGKEIYQWIRPNYVETTDYIAAALWCKITTCSKQIDTLQLVEIRMCHWHSRTEICASELIDPGSDLVRKFSSLKAFGRVEYFDWYVL